MTEYRIHLSESEMSDVIAALAIFCVRSKDIQAVDRVDTLRKVFIDCRNSQNKSGLSPSCDEHKDSKGF